MKILKCYICFLFLIALGSCKKETLYIINPPITPNNIDSVNIDIYLLDYDSIDLGNTNASGQHIFDYQNSNHFHHPYAVTRCLNQVLDSISLTYADSTYSLNMNPDDLIPDFSFSNILTYCMPNEVQNIHINRDKTTSLEIWDNNIKLGTFLIGSYGIYGEVIDNAVYARSYLSAEHSFKTLTTI